MTMRRIVRRGQPTVDTLQGLRAALAEEQARGRVVAAQLSKERDRLSGMLEELTTLRALHGRVASEYDARRATYQDREDQITRLTRYIYTYYLWEIRSGEHKDMKQVDIAMRYMEVERRRWRVRLRNWWYRRVKHRKLWKASMAAAQGYGRPEHRCLKCGLPTDSTQDVYCQKCLKDLDNLTERAR